jgi:hypothetical protein
MHGKVLGADFVVPVTLTFFGQIYLEFGFFFTVLGAFFIGYFVAWLIWVTGRENRVVQRALLYYVQLTIFSILVKGNLIYDVADKLATLVFFFIWVSPLFLFFVLRRRNHFFYLARRLRVSSYD